MDILDILKKAEKELREAIAEAARAGDYRAVDLGRSVAVGVKELYEQAAGKRKVSEKSAGDEKETGGRKRRRKIGKRNKPDGYPRFEVRNGTLFKIGWSRKQRVEYEHKTPRAIYDLIVSTMSNMEKAKSGPFTAEVIIEEMNRTNEEIVPAYQVYVVLAALRAWGLVSQMGREGYNITKDISEKANQAWRDKVSK